MMLIAQAKSRSARGESYQPSCMASCLAISHTCLPCLPSRRTLLQSHLLVTGKALSCERSEGSEQGGFKRREGGVLGRWVQWEGSELGRCERGRPESRRAGKDRRIVRQQGSRGWSTVTWQVREGSFSFLVPDLHFQVIRFSSEVLLA